MGQRRGSGLQDGDYNMIRDGGQLKVIMVVLIVEVE